MNIGYDNIYFYSKTESHKIVPPQKKDEKGEHWHSFDAPELRTGMDYELFGQKPPKGRHWMRTKKDRNLELKSIFKECTKGRRKIAVKVVDIFGNDTMKIIEVTI